MADFCKQCSEEVLGEDFGDLAGITQPHDTERGLYVEVLCEGCGPTEVDHTGKCVSSHCMKEHGNESK